MSKKISFDEFLKQQQQAQQQPRGYGYKNSNNYQYSGQNFQYSGQSFQPGQYYSGYQGYQGYQGFQNQAHTGYQGYPEQSFSASQNGSEVPSGAESRITSGAATPNPDASTTSLSSLGSALNKLKLEETPILEHLTAIQKCSKISDSKKEAEAIAQKVAEQPSMTIFDTWKILDILSLIHI